MNNWLKSWPITFRLFSKGLCSLALVVFCATSAFSETMPFEKCIATCAAIEGDLSRLECFDDLAYELGIVRPINVSTDIEGTGKWEIIEEINPIDDSRSVKLYLISDSGTSTWGDPIILILRCLSNQTEVFIRWNDYLGDRVRVVTRLGKESSTEKRWLISTDGLSTFYPESGVDFIRRLISCLSVRCSNYTLQRKPRDRCVRCSWIDSSYFSAANSL